MVQLQVILINKPNGIKNVLLNLTRSIIPLITSNTLIGSDLMRPLAHLQKSYNLFEHQNVIPLYTAVKINT